MKNEHGYCPNCSVDLDGGSIWQHFYERSGSEEEADKSAEMYGANRFYGKWGRVISIYSVEKDRTMAWLCPDCGHKWPR